MNRSGPEIYFRGLECLTIVDHCFAGSVARLVIRDILAEDSGTYCCVASNDAGESDCSSQVTVRSKSAFRKKYLVFFRFLFE